MKLNFKCEIFNKRSCATLVAFAISFIAVNTPAQSFSSKNIDLVDYNNEFNIQEIMIDVKGLPTKMDNKFGFEGIKLNITHQRTSDLKIQLQAPDGTTCWISNRNGGDFGADYENTKFSQYGKNGLINNGKNPFIGEFTPDGQITYFNNGSNPNGIWKLLIEDLRQNISGKLDYVTLIFGKHPALIQQKKNCSMENPEFCKTTKNGKLLPDMVIIPAFTKNQWQEYGKDDAKYPGQLKISVAIANIGIGPLEVNTDISKNLTTTLAEKRYQLTQKIYSLKKRIFTEKSIKTGSIYFESKPGHQHYHVDDWIEIRILKEYNGKVEIKAKGTKVSYCLFTNGMLTEKEETSNIFGKKYGSNIPNYGLGTYSSCELTRQGISVGGYDYYGAMYEGQYLQLPKDFKNGDYILEIEIDPNHLYKESNTDNNIFRIPIKIEKQN